MNNNIATFFNFLISLVPFLAAPISQIHQHHYILLIFDPWRPSLKDIQHTYFSIIKYILFFVDFFLK